MLLSETQARRPASSLHPINDDRNDQRGKQDQRRFLAHPIQQPGRAVVLQVVGHDVSLTMGHLDIPRLMAIFIASPALSACTSPTSGMLASYSFVRLSSTGLR